MAKKMPIKVLCCLVVLVILMCAMPVSVAAINNSNTTGNASSEEMIQSNDTIHAQYQMPFSPLSKNEHNVMKDAKASISSKELATTSTAPEEEWNVTFNLGSLDEDLSVQQTSDGG